MYWKYFVELVKAAPLGILHVKGTIQVQPCTITDSWLKYWQQNQKVDDDNRDDLDNERMTVKTQT